MRFQEAFIEIQWNEGEGTGEDFFPNKYAVNDPYQPREEEFFYDLPDEYYERRRLIDLENLRKRADNFTNGVNITENLQRIDINLMRDAPNNWHYFPLPSKSQLLSMMASLENIGLVYPIILLKEEDGTYTILDGNTRYLALHCLNTENPSKKYRYPLCYVLDPKKVDEHYIRALMLDLNFHYRKIPQNVFIKMILERHEILKRSKSFRGEINIAEKLAEEFLVSPSSIYSYLSLKKLCEEVLTLVFKSRMQLQVARLFTKLDHNTQKLILENIDFKEINSYHKMKYIVTEDLGTMGEHAEKEIKRRVRNAQEMVPETISFTVKLDKGLIMKFSEQVMELMKYAVNKFRNAVASTGMRKYCEVKYNKRQMRYMVKGNYMDEKTLERLGARTISDVYRK